MEDIGKESKNDRTDFNNALLDYGLLPYQIKAIDEIIDKTIAPWLRQKLIEARIEENKWWIDNYGDKIIRAGIDEITGFQNRSKELQEMK